MAVHPALGVARVGNSEDLYFLPPETPGAIPLAPDGFRDEKGALAKQAARFRLYAYDADGVVLGEVTNQDAEIEWSVSVANKKAQWYQFDTAMDIRIAEPVGRRNAKVKGEERANLVSQSHENLASTSNKSVPLDGGMVFGQRVALGEILSDADGRLLFLPGSGEALSKKGAELEGFAENDGWTDTVCDGSVEAQVSINGRKVSVDPGWVIVTAPNYGPGMPVGFQTGLDEVKSALVTSGMLAVPNEVSFARDIYPLFERQTQMQWVNAGYYEMTRKGQPYDWESEEVVAQLADNSAAGAKYRQGVFEQFRNPDYREMDVNQLPPYIGDGIRHPPSNDYAWLAVTRLQYKNLKKWAAGDFIDDRGSYSPPPESLNDIPEAMKPQALDEASLTSLLGGAHHPGVEAPWTLRQASMWESPYRLKVLSTDVKLRDYGKELTPATAMGPNGPIHGVTPGDLTMWMGVPWQADGASCRSGYRMDGYNPDFNKYLPTFWPSRIPNEVLTEADYEVVLDTSRTDEERLDAFNTRRSWMRSVADIKQPDKQLDAFVAGGWTKMGLVTQQPGPTDGRFGDSLRVETLTEFVEPESHSQNTYRCSVHEGVTCPVNW